MKFLSLSLSTRLFSRGPTRGGKGISKVSPINQTGEGEKDVCGEGGGRFRVPEWGKQVKKCENKSNAFEFSFPETCLVAFSVKSLES